MDNKPDASSMDNRQYHHESTSAYSLPNDIPEHQRLEAQAEALDNLMHNNITHCPLQNPKRILDIGCGTGRETVQLAQKFPEAQIFGIDLSPVPAIHPKPKNVEYIQGNVRDLIKARDPRIGTWSFDFVYSRLLSMGETDWTGYFADVSSILAPGGWLEVHEYEIAYRSADGGDVPKVQHIMIKYQDLLRHGGFDPLIAHKCAPMMRDSGLADVEETTFSIPLFETPSRPETALATKIVQKLPAAMSTVWARLGEGLYSKEEQDRYRQELIDSVAQIDPGTQIHYVVATGRKE